MDTPEPIERKVRAFWDAEAEVFVAESDDVPGLVTEASTLEALVEKLKIIIPELLEENAALLPASSQARRPIPFLVMAELHATTAETQPS